MEIPKENLSIQTPEQVGFQYTLGGLGTRATAFLLDTAFRVLLTLSIFSVVTLLTQALPSVSPTDFMADLSGNWIMAIGILAYGVVDLGYFLLFEAMWSGQTPGKRLQKLRVIRINGRPIGWLESSIRNILRAVDILAGFYPLGLIVIFLSKHSQRIGDYVAGTVVIVERRRPVPTNRTRLRSSVKLLIPDIELHISTLDTQQYQLLQSYLLRRQEMDRDHREQLAGDMARRLIEQWGLHLEETISHESFLEEVVGAYERTRRAI